MLLMRAVSKRGMVSVSGILQNLNLLVTVRAHIHPHSTVSNKSAKIFSVTSPRSKISTSNEKHK